MSPNYSGQLSLSDSGERVSRGRREDQNSTGKIGRGETRNSLIETSVGTAVRAVALREKGRGEYNYSMVGGKSSISHIGRHVGAGAKRS